MSGIAIDIDPVIATLGGFTVRWYGVAVGGGILAGIWLTVREARRRSLDPDAVGAVALWAVAGGLLGARLLHVVDRLPEYLEHPARVLMVHEGGLAIWGGLLGGGVAALLAARHYALPLPRLADAAAIGLLPGQMLGRLGCIVTGDAAGTATALPWGFIYARPDAMVPEALRGVATHPYPVYEIAWGLALLGLLLLLRARPLPAGVLFLVYAGGYALGRFTLGFVRREVAVLGELQQAQVMALGVLVAVAVTGLWMLGQRRRSQLDGPVPVAGRDV